MAAGTDLEQFREIFKDQRQHIAVAKIVRLSMASDRSVLMCEVSVWPEERIIIAQMTWDAVGPESGVFFFPVVGDLVLVAFAEGDVEHAFVIKRLTSREDKIPLKAGEGDLVLKALTGKLGWISAFKIYLTKSHTAPTENLVLGQQLKTLLSGTLAKLQALSNKVEALSTEISTHTHAGNLGYPTSPPNTAAAFTSLATDFTGLGEDFDAFKTSPVDDEAILSDVAYTEKGE